MSVRSSLLASVRLMQQLVRNFKYISFIIGKGRCCFLVFWRVAFLALVLLLFYVCWIRVMITSG